MSQKAVRGCFRVIGLILLACIEAAAQRQITFSHLSIDENLSQSSVYAIEQDAYGFMWFGTRDGLNRYDSHKNIVYRREPEDSTSLSSSSINVITKDKQGNLWIGTSGGLNLYRPRTDDFRRMRHDTSGHSISYNNISAIVQTADGSLWVGTRRGLNRLKAPGTAKFEQLMMEGNTADESGAFDIKSLYEDTKQNLWVGTTVGLSRVRRRHDGVYEVKHFYLHPEDSVWHNTSNWVNTIAEDRQGRLWIGTETKGIALFDPAQGKVTSWHPIRGLDLSNFAVRTIQPDESGQFWIGTMSGLLICGQDGVNFRRFVNAPDQPGSLSDNSIRAIYRSHEGTVWIGTFYGGVNHYNPFSQQFGSLRLVNGAGRKPFKIAGPMMAAADHHLWVGSDDKGLFLVDETDKIVQHYRHDPENPNSLSNDKIKCLLRNGTRGLWIGTIKGLNYMDFATGTITRYLSIPNVQGSLPDDRIYGLSYDKEGQLWIATFRGGLCKMDPETGKFEQFSYQDRSEKGPPSNSITCLLIDSKERIWLGTTTGLAQKVRGEGRFIHYKAGPQNAISGNYVVGLFEDSRGHIWISTRGAGLNRYDPETGQFIHYSKADGLGGDNVFGVSEDSAGNFWIATDDGLSKLDPASGVIITYDRNDGLVCKEFLPNSVFDDRQGKLYFGGYNGIVRFAPDSIRINPMRPSIVFTGLKLFNKPVEIGGTDGILREHLLLTPALEFNHRQNVFSVEFASINYIDAQKNQYAYLLEGFEEEWNYVKEPVATYMNLEPGTYTLKIKGSNNNGVWSNEPLEMKITILPPPWKTTWAYIGYVAAFLGLLYTWSRYHRERLQLAHDLELEHMEKKQQEELHQTRIHFFTNIIHEIRTPLTLIMGPMKILEEDPDANGILKRQLEVMQGSTNRLMRLVEQLLDFQKHEMGTVRIKARKLDLEEWLEEVRASFQSYAIARQIRLKVISHGRPLWVWFDPEEMEKVFHNLLINAFKFTPTGGEIRISTRISSDGQVKIAVEDNGIGIAREELDRIFQRFYQTGDRQNSGFGIGLALSKNIVELHQGTIEVESEESGLRQNGFTRFVISLPPGAASEMAGAPEDMPLRTTRLLTDVSFSENEAEESRETGKGMKNPLILLVEDQDDLRNYVKELLAGAYEIVEASNGAAGWDLACRILPDLIVSDISMPIMDGVTLTGRIKTDERTNHIPVILLTAYDSVQQQVKGLEQGADDYVPKPFHPKVLLTRIRNLLRVREELKEKYKHKVSLEPLIPEQATHPDAVFLQKLMKVIEENISNPELNLADLVQELGMSRPVLFRKIKMLTDCSVMDLVRSVRMKKAEALLKQKTMTVSEVAFAVGFNDPKYFSKSFRSQFGKAPSEYIAG